MVAAKQDRSLRAIDAVHRSHDGGSGRSGTPRGRRRAGAPEAGFKRKQFEDPDNLISYDAMGRLFARGVAHTRCEHLGLLVGKQGGLHSLGLVGLLVNCSKDVETALRGLERHFHLRVRGAALVIDIEGDAARMGTSFIVGSTRPTRSTTARSPSFSTSFVPSAARRGSPRRFSSRAGARRRSAVRRFFGAPLRFDADLHAVVFSASWLSLAPASHRPDPAHAC